MTNKQLKEVIKYLYENDLLPSEMEKEDFEMVSFKTTYQNIINKITN